MAPPTGVRATALSDEEGFSPATAAEAACRAVRRGDWPQALRCWDAALAGSAGAPNPAWRAMRGEALLQLGHIEEAEAVFLALPQTAPCGARAAAGLARVAMRRWQWPQALLYWDRALGGGGCGAVRHWRLGRAVALRRLLRFAEAETVLRPLLQDDPGFVESRLELITMLTAAGRFADALHEASGGEAAGFATRRIDILLRLQRHDEAAAEFRRALARANGAAEIDPLFPLVPRLFEGWPRTRTWLSFQRRLRQATGAERGSCQAAILGLRIRLALRDYAGFLREVDRRGADMITGEHRSLLLATANALREPGFPDRQKPKVFGIGLSRTGTTPLTLALRSLGLTALHCLQPLTGEMLGEADFDLVDAASDTPLCVGFEKLYLLYPRAKFIYTARPVEAWQVSFRRYLERRWGTGDFTDIGRLLARPKSFHFGGQWSAIHSALYFNHASYEDAYHVHDRRVRHFFRDKPEDRFLEFEVFAGDGWEKLCNFLGRPIPAQPFPQPLA